MTILDQQAKIYRTSLTFGVLGPKAAIAWADAVIASGADVPTAIYDLSLTPADQPKQALAALRSLSDSDLDETTVRAVLDLVRVQVEAGELTASEAIQTAYRVTRPLAPEAPLWLEAMMLEENYSLAVDRIVGTVEDMDAEVREWLAQFTGAASAIYDSAR